MLDQMDIKPLREYLCDKLDVKEESIKITQFKGGFSNLTFLVESDQSPIVLRRPPFGEKISKAHDMTREFSVLSALQKAGYDKIPDPLFLENDESIFGAPFFAMSYVDGLILRNNTPELKSFQPADFEKLSEDSLDALIQLHGLELKDSGLIELGKPEGYISRQVIGWSERYFRAKTNKLPDFENGIKWLQDNIPDKENVGFIHNDFKYDNIILSKSPPYSVQAILDWEMATVGDPLMDLGTSLAYWAQKEDTDILKMFNLTHLPGNLSRKEVAAYYQSKSNLDLSYIQFYYIFGLIKVGVIAQQIFKRFSLGHAKDPRFGALIHVVEAAGKQANKTIQTGEI